MNSSEHTTRRGHRVLVDHDSDAGQVAITAWADEFGRTPAPSTLRALAAAFLPAPPVLMRPWTSGVADGRACVRGTYA